jgi:RHS repeat-associated protein
MKPHIFIFIILAICFLASIELSAQNSDQNYIVNTVPIMAVTDPTALNNTNANSTIQYYDGLGRPVETVLKAQSSKNGSTWVDLVNLTEYDGLGREYKHWLPTPASSNSGTYIDPTTFTSSANSFYSTLTDDTNPYSESMLESSPLNRPLGQKSPGAAWNAHPTGISYQPNTASDNVFCLFVNSNNQLERISTYTYPANVLFKTVLNDEDGKTTTEFKNKEGKVIMKRSDTNADTYYVYNDFGQLCYVIPPVAAPQLAGATVYGDNDQLLTKYAYLYKYDERGNNVVKRLPGCDSICMVYDIAGRLVLSQDGNQRANGKWIVTKYDVYGRVLYTGFISSTLNRVQYKSMVKDQLITETFNGSTSFYSTGYTCTGSLTGITPLTVNYYDNYAYLMPPLLSNYSSFTWVAPPTGYDAQFGSTMGLLTGTRTYILDKTISNYLATTFYYDDHGRVVQTRSSNHLGGYDNVYNHYDFTGKVLKTRKEHNISGQAIIPEVYRYAYDKAERLVTSLYKLGTNDTITLASNSYDELGRMTTVLRHNNTDNCAYEYNIRNWTTKIKSGTFEEDLYYNSNPLNSNLCFNGNISYSTWTYGSVNKGYAYTYDGLNRLTNAAFKQGTSGQPNGYFDETFSYDSQGNILTLQRKKDNILIDNLAITPNGNQITSVIDYAGSQNSASIKEYQNKSTATNVQEFFYDPNGNLTADLDRDIVTIQYNLLNLPDIIQFKNGNQIFNRYAADGRKLGTEYFTQLVALAAPVTQGTVLNQVYSYNMVSQNGTAYIDNKEYSTSNGNTALTALNRVHNTEGYSTYLNNANVSVNYNYFRRDHLGNNREVWCAPYIIYVANNAVAGAYTAQQIQYYPSGLPWSEGTASSTQPYKYNGKEFVEMHGYDTYDYGARGYYPALDILPTVDPHAERYYWISPYAYCLNNPVNATDPDGRDVYKLGFSYSMSSGVFGFSLKILGIGLGGTVSPGAVRQELGFYISYDSDNRSVGVGTTHTKTIIDSGNSVTVGPYKHSESNEKAEVRDANTTNGYTKTVDKSLTKSESGGIGVIETTEKKGVATTGVSVSGEIGAGLVGVSAKMGITVEPSSSTKPTQNKPAASSSTPSSTPAPGTAPLRPKEPTYSLF